jgi:cytochrome c553
LWTCFPDGCNPRAPHGNYAFPWGRWADWSGPFSESREDIHGVKCRPYAELHIRAVPGSHRYVATAAPHHGWAFGSLVLLDTRVPDDYLMSQVKRITPDAKFPESEGHAAAGEYATPWALSEDFYLCNYRRSLWLVDRFGNRELILAKSEVPGKLDNDFDLLDPIPLRPRPKPPAIPWQTAEGDGAGQPRPKAAISIQNVYETDQAWPEGTKIAAVRVVQVSPPARSADYTGIGYDREQLARMSLGVVPVEADGSAHFEAPVGKTILFQALDEKGRAVQTMRSATYVHPGEHLSCVGCHESPSKAASQPQGTPLAMRRPPSKLAAELPRVEPLSFHRHVKPILEAKCAACHVEKKQAPDMSYASLQPYAFYFMSDIAGPRKSQLGKLVGKGGTRSLSGKIGARAAKLSKYLDESHYDVVLSKDELRTLTLWLDLSSPEYGVYPRDGGNREKAGELVWPLLDVDPENPTGVERSAAFVPAAPAPSRTSAVASQRSE